jgi:exodeoxyribonuclease X
MNEAFVVIDLETTDREPKDAHIVEWAAILITAAVVRRRRRALHGGLVKPPVPIPAETSAVHHIIDADVATAPTWESEWRRSAARALAAR